MIKSRIRRTMMFLNAQRASLVKDAYVYKPDCVIFDLEDAVAQREKDSARVQLYNTLKYLDYHSVERWVRINALDTPFYSEDIRASVAGGCEGIRIAKTETPNDVKLVEDLVLKAEIEFGREEGSTMLMGALESPQAILNVYDICKSSSRLMGIALSAGDYTRTLHAKRTSKGDELFYARSHIVNAARAAGVMCFDTVHTDLSDMEGFVNETRLIMEMGYDGKSVISPKQISIVHDIFTPSDKEIEYAVHVIEAVKENEENGVGVLIVDGQMVDIAHVEGARRALQLAKAAGAYRGDLA